MLEHSNPSALMRANVAPHVAIRDHFRDKMSALGFEPPIGNQIRSISQNAPQYDLIVVSRNPAAKKLYLGATQKRPDGQRRLELSV